MSGRFARGARWIAAAGVVLVLLGLGALGLVHSGRFDAWLTNYLSVRLDKGFRFAGARAVWWPRPGVVLDDVAFDRIGDTPAIGTAAAAAVTCRLRLDALLGGRVEIGSVRVDGLHLAVVRGADGALHAGGLETFADSDGGDEPTGLFPAVPVIRVHGGTLEYGRDPQFGTGELRLTAVNAQAGPRDAGIWAALSAAVDGGGSVTARATLESADAPSSAPFTADVDVDAVEAAALRGWLPPLDGVGAQGRARATASVVGDGDGAIDGDVAVEIADGGITWNDWQAAAPLRAAVHATWDGDSLALSQGTLDVARVVHEQLTAETLVATFAYAERTLRVDSAALRALGGTLRPSGRVRFGPPAQIEAVLDADGIDGEQLTAAARAFGVSAALPRLDAPLRLDARASGQTGGAWEGRASLATNGNLTWQAAQVDGPLQVSADLGFNDGALSVSNGRAHARRVSQAGIAVDGLDAAFSYAHGQAAVAPLRGNAFGGTWTYSGGLPLQPTTPWRGHIEATGVSIAALGGALAPASTSGEGNIDLRAELSGIGVQTVNGPINIALSSPEFAWNRLRVTAPASLSATLHRQGARLRLSDGQGRAHGLRFEDVAVQEVNTAFAYGDDRLSVTRLDAKAFHGAWSASGTARLGAAPTFTAKVQAKRVDLDDLFDELERRVSDSPRAADGIGDMTLEMSREADGDITGSATMKLQSGSFAFDDLHVQGPAHGASQFSLRGDTLRLTKATAQAAHASYGPLDTSDTTASFDLAGSRLTFSDLRFSSCGGKWTHTGWFTLDAGGPFAGQLVVDDAVPSQVATMLGTNSAGLTFATLDLDSEFSGRAVADFTARLQATGSMYLNDGTMRAANVLRPIWEALVGGGRVSDAMSRPTTHVQEISGTFTLQSGRIDSPDLSLVSDDYSATALGSIGLDGSLNLHARIQVTSQGVQKMLVFGSLPLPTEILPKLPPIPASVTGTVDNPILRPNVAALPATTVRWLVDVLLQTPRSLGESVTHRLGQLWDGARRLVGAGQ